MVWRARESSIIVVMMLARELTELIVNSAGYDPGILPKSVFFMLVVMAVDLHDNPGCRGGHSAAPRRGTLTVPQGLIRPPRCEAHPNH